MLLTETINLPGHKFVIRLALTPMPRPSKDGTYLKFYKRRGKAAQQPKIHLEFVRDCKTFDKRGWGSVISGAETLRLHDGTVLNDDDLSQIDDKGWDILAKYGMFPAEMVMPPGWTPNRPPTPMPDEMVEHVIEAHGRDQSSKFE